MLATLGLTFATSNTAYAYPISGIMNVIGSTEGNYKTQRVNAGVCAALSDMLRDALLNAEKSDISLIIDKADVDTVDAYIETTTEEEAEPVIEETEPVVEETYNYTSLSVPNGQGICDSAKRTYMGYHLVTDRSTNQYWVLHGKHAWTDEYGLRHNGDRICVAVGTYYGVGGDKIDIVLADGTVVKAVIGDIKADCHTDETNRYQKYDGSVVEMIIDKYSFTDVPDYLKQTIVEIRNLNENIVK